MGYPAQKQCPMADNKNQQEVAHAQLVIATQSEVRWVMQACIINPCNALCVRITCSSVSETTKRVLHDILE